MANHLTAKDKIRCPWATQSERLQKYHDAEWGIPVHDENKIFEMLILEGLQAGLSWDIVLQKRETYKEAFDDLSPSLIANYDQKKLDQLLNNKGLIRNKLKMAAIVNNAQRFLNVQAEYTRFADYIWQFVNYKPICNHPKTEHNVPTQSELSLKLSHDLKKRGFKFVGPVICYSFMQAIGMINDHLVDCFCYQNLQID